MKKMLLPWDEPYGLSSLSKTRMCNHLQISEQGQDILLSYVKTLNIGPAEVWTGGLPGFSLVPTGLTGHTGHRKTEKRNHWFRILLLNDYANESSLYKRPG